MHDIEFGVGLRGFKVRRSCEIENCCLARSVDRGARGNTARAVAEQLIRTGRVERGYVGLRLQELTPALAQALGRPADEGVLVAAVEPGGPAERAGIRTGDVITALNGEAIKSGRELSRSVASMRPGTDARMTIVRDGKAQELTISIGQRGDDRPSRSSDLDPPDGGKRLGVALSPLPEAARGQLGLEPGVSGVLVQRVEPGSPAAENGLRSGDIIVSANSQGVAAPSDVANAWTEAQKQKRPMLLRVRRNEQYLFVAIGA